MSSENLSPEQQEELREAKSAEELEQIAKKHGQELSTDMLDGVSGGGNSSCTRYCDLAPACATHCGWRGCQEAW